MPMHNIPHASPSASTALTFGWGYSTVTVLSEEPSSWTFTVDQRRIPSDKTDIEVAVEQLQEIVPKLSSRPLLLFAPRLCVRLVLVSVPVNWHAMRMPKVKEQPSFLQASTATYGQTRATT
jgi:hypothetical protein